MYNTSDLYKKKIIESDRTFAVKIEVNNDPEKTLTGTTIQSIAFDELVNSEDSLTMGCACSNKVTINLIDAPTNVIYDGATLKPYVGLKIKNIPETYEWIPMGIFYVTEFETRNNYKNLKLTAYDGFCKMTGVYENPGTNHNLQSAYDDLRTKLAGIGVVMKAADVNDILTLTYTNQRTNGQWFVYYPEEDLSYTQAVSYLAGALGGFARFNKDGELEVIWYEDTGIVVDEDLQYMNGFTKTTSGDIEIKGITSGTGNKTFKRGSLDGNVINYTNPYMVKELLMDIYRERFDSDSKITYTPSTLKWRGDPSIQAGDLIKAIDNDGNECNIYVMSQQITVGGGCNATIECKGKPSVVEKAVSSFSTTSQKIEKVYTTLSKSIIQATSIATGNEGGSIVLNDANGDNKPDEIFVLVDSLDVGTATKCWRIDKTGIGFSNTGINGNYQMAIKTADNGFINAENIIGGSSGRPETILYKYNENENGTLNDSVANYEYIEVFYYDTSGQYGNLKVKNYIGRYSFSGSLFSLLNPIIESATIDFNDKTFTLSNNKSYNASTNQTTFNSPIEVDSIIGY